MNVRKRDRKSAIELCEEAVALLRRAPAATLAAYYIGAAPFALGFLFFWADMSRGAFAAERCAPASLGVAFLFLWMIAWRNVFVRGLRSLISRTPAEIKHRGVPWKSFLIQWTLQPTKFISLPLAALATLPFAWAYAFYHHLMAAPAERVRGFAETFNAARRQATAWHEQNWILISLFTLVTFVVFLNFLMAMIIAPQLLKSFLGVDSVFTRGGYRVLNSTFLAVAGALTYLIVNPFVAAVYALRSFYVESLETGEDLRAELRGAVAAVLLLLCMVGITAQAQTPVTRERLDGSIERVIHRAEFTWRLPRAARPADQTENWFVRSTRSFLAASDREFTRIKNAVSRFLDWLGEKLTPASPPDSNAPQRMARDRLRLIYAVLLAVVAALLVYFGQQLARRRRSPKVETAAAGAAPALDLTREDVLADQQPAEEWLELARGLLAAGDYRTALRALYLAALAQLASQGLIAIRRSKSNQDYVRELARRARSQPELMEAFRKSVGLFERTWYGMYDVDAAGVRDFEELLPLMRTRAEA